MYWNSLNDRLREQYGTKVYKLALSSGCSCPNRDGTLGDRGCIFCDGAGAFAAAGDIPAQLAAAKARVAAKAGPDARYIAYFQSFTNTYGPVDRLRQLYRAAGDLLEAPEDWMAGYKAHCITIGQDVKIVRGDRVQLAHVDDMDDQGALLVTLADGRKDKVLSGEVSVRGMYGYVE